jgi:hypothetical protein
LAATAATETERRLNMDLVERDIQSFIVKIWQEETGEETGGALWRGRITHVPDNAQTHFQDLTDIPLFIMPYLQDVGIQVGIRWRLCRRFKWLAGFRRRRK